VLHELLLHVAYNCCCCCCCCISCYSTLQWQSALQLLVARGHGIVPRRTDLNAASRLRINWAGDAEHAFHWDAFSQ
jgi:hypothetical protein